MAFLSVLYFSLALVNMNLDNMIYLYPWSATGRDSNEMTIATVKDIFEGQDLRISRTVLAIERNSKTVMMTLKNKWGMC